MDMKTDLRNAIGQVFRRRWTLSILVAGAWTAVVTLYVLNGLRPHGYIGDETEALFTWLGWMVGGGFLLAWVVRKFLFDSALRFHSMHQSAPAHTLTTGGDDESEDLWIFGRENRNTDDDPYWNPTYATSINNAWHRND